MTSKNPFMQTPSLSPIASVSSKTSLLSRTTSNDALLQSTPNTFTLRDMEDFEYSLSSIDLESLILFPDSEIDLALHIPEDKIVPKRSSVFIEHLPPRRKPDQRKRHRMSWKFHSMVNQVHKSFGYTKNPKIMCGTKDGRHDSDSESDDEFDMSGKYAQLASRTPSATLSSSCIAPTMSEDVHASSFYSPHTDDTGFKRRAIYGSDAFSPKLSFALDTPASAHQHRASLYSPAGKAPNYELTPDASPSIEYQKRRKSAFASLG